MRVNVVNRNGKFVAMAPDGEFPVLHSYVRQDVCHYDKRTQTFSVVGARRIGVVVAVIVGDEIFYGWSKVAPPDNFDRAMGIRIAVGRALTRPLVDLDEFYESAGRHTDILDSLLGLYNRVQRYLLH